MNRIRDFISYLKENPQNYRIWLLNKFSFLFSDEQYIKTIYHVNFKVLPDLINPVTFNEKLNWLKLHYHNPRLTLMADKYAVKRLVSDLIGEQYVVPCYGVWGKWEDIPFESLPEQFVLKGTHDSGGAFVCKDKSSFNYTEVKHQLKKNLKRDFFLAGREWPYKNIPHRILADKFLDDHTGKELRDYKFWCFNGKPMYMYVTIKGKNVYENFYDIDFNIASINHGFPRHQPEFEKPEKFDEMKKLATILSEGIPFVRVDFFQVDGHVYFGEFTFFDWGGLRPFTNNQTDIELGNLIDLPEEAF